MDWLLLAQDAQPIPTPPDWITLFVKEGPLALVFFLVICGIAYYGPQVIKGHLAMMEAFRVFIAAQGELNRRADEYKEQQTQAMTQQTQTMSKLSDTQTAIHSEIVECRKVSTAFKCEGKK